METRRFYCYQKKDFCRFRISYCPLRQKVKNPPKFPECETIAYQNLVDSLSEQDKELS